MNEKLSFAQHNWKELLDSVTRELRGQEFQGNSAFELCVLRFVDNTHATLADLLEDFAVGHGFADHYSIDNFINNFYNEIKLPYHNYLHL